MENNEQTQNVQENLPQLTVNDLSNIKTILEVAVKRGVFGANEISAVGAIYDKLTAFLNAVQPKTEQSSNQTPETQVQ